jgi:hypothetical protein
MMSPIPIIKFRENNIKRLVKMVKPRIPIIVRAELASAERTRPNLLKRVGINFDDNNTAIHDALTITPTVKEFSPLFCSVKDTRGVIEPI